MKIKKLQLKNFKRFTDLIIDEIPNDAKLVLLIGSNGSGKSSVFDAFEMVNSSEIPKRMLWTDMTPYYRKNKSKKIEVTLTGEDGETFFMDEDNSFSRVHPNTFYGRTSFRQVPFLTRTSFGQNKFDVNTDSDRPRRFIDNDVRFENDIENVIVKVLKDVYSPDTSSTTEKIKETYIVPINRAFDNIFGEGNGTKLQLTELIPPTDGNVAQINFKKGVSEIHYDNLSAGEKEIFNILLNLLSRKDLYTDTIYFFDEIDLHLNTKLQYNLLKEITENWIPENCQLWTASHSLGFIEYAKQSNNAVIIDFDNLDFDLPQVLVPEPKDNPDIYEIAVGKEFLPALFAQMAIYFVENKDRDYYATVGLPNTVFVSDNNRNNVYHKVRSTEYKGIVDRDFLSDSDITEIKANYNNLRILNYYCIENYMYHPDNLEQYYKTKSLPFNKAEYIINLTEAKNQIKNSIIPSLSLKRTEYPYFGEPDFNGTPSQNRFKNKQENMDESGKVAEYLNSDDLETYYKSLPMKTYCTTLHQRQNIAKSDLVKTNWFKQQIESIIKG